MFGIKILSKPKFNTLFFTEFCARNERVTTKKKFLFLSVSVFIKKLFFSFFVNLLERSEKISFCRLHPTVHIQY